MSQSSAAPHIKTLVDHGNDFAKASRAYMEAGVTDGSKIAGGLYAIAFALITIALAVEPQREQSE
jgi:hypothetical protein